MNKVYTFSDILKDSVKQFSIFQKVSTTEIFINMIVALLAALFIFYIYRSTFRGVVYNYGFNISLCLICLIVASIIMTISSNVALSLGMVGALSIVRFRTALKDPLDIMFMFWSISAGICAGAGIYPVLIVSSLVIGISAIIFSKIRFESTNYVLVVNYNEEVNEAVRKILDRYRYKLKSKNMSGSITELTVTMKIVHNNTAFLNELSETNGVSNAVLVAYNGEYAE